MLMTVPLLSAAMPTSLLLLAGHARIGEVKVIRPVNGGAAVERHHAEPGVVKAYGAGVASGGVAIGIGEPATIPELVR